MKHQLVTEQVSISSLKLHPKNVRQGDVGAISESLKEHGQYRPIVVQRSTNYVLAGNHTLKAAKALGWSDIAVTYVDCDDDRATRILVADNRTTDLASYDDRALADLLTEIAKTDGGLAGTAFTEDDIDDLLRELGREEETTEEPNAYTQKVKIPQYEIVGEEPDIAELVDMSRVEKLQFQIEKTDLPEPVKRFLIFATMRHARFNYRKIAEWYPHQPAEIQKLMEDSVLVIIDADNAIANGYASFAQTMNDLIEDDRDA